MTDLQIPATGSRLKMQRLLWAECKASGLRQTEIAVAADVTPKHLNQIMRGHITGSLDAIDRILAAIGRELVISTRLIVEPPTDGSQE